MENIDTNTKFKDSEVFSTLGELVDALLAKGQYTWKQKWTLLERPLKVQGRNAPHIHGVEYGHVMEDDYKNGISIARNDKGVYINLFTHWLGQVYCSLAIHLRPDDFSFVCGTIHRLAFGLWKLDEDGAIQCMRALLHKVDSFKWSKGRKRTVVYGDLM